MKTTLKLLAAAAIAMCTVSCNDEPVRVACMGDSITYGHGIADRENDTYPGILKQKLGKKYEVRNFGVCGVTAMDGTDMPYINEQEYRNALEFNPHLVILMLGTNDTKPYNWKDRSKFKADMKAMIDTLRSLPAKPEIWLMLPTPVTSHAFFIDGSIIDSEIVPAVRELAQEESLPFVDLNTPFQGKEQYFMDTVHPTEQGDSIIADIVFNTVFRIKR